MFKKLYFSKISKIALSCSLFFYCPLRLTFFVIFIAFNSLDLWGESLVRDDDKEETDTEHDDSEPHGDVQAKELVDPGKDDGAEDPGEAAGGGEHSHPEAL